MRERVPVPPRGRGIYELSFSVTCRSILTCLSEQSNKRESGASSGELWKFLGGEGGGWCNTIRNCVYRKTTRRGSSKFMEKQLPFTGILSNKPEENPDFFNWNRVKLRYCDGASFTGDSQNEVEEEVLSDICTSASLEYRPGRPARSSLQLHTHRSQKQPPFLSSLRSCTDCQQPEETSTVCFDTLPHGRPPAKSNPPSLIMTLKISGSNTTNKHGNPHSKFLLSQYHQREEGGRIPFS
ncbi:hypothetical protein ACLB2K_007969 [Fragaria x ananassa]